MAKTTWNVSSLARKKTCPMPDTRWIVVISAFTAGFITAGISYSTSIYYVEWIESFGESYSLTSTVASLNIGLSALLGPLAGVLVSYIGYSWVFIIAGLVSLTGMLSAVFANNIYVLIVTFGIITGFGYGIAFSPLVVMAPTFFPEKQALAQGFAISGIGLGTIVMPLLIESTFVSYGWRGSVLILAGISLNLTVCGVMIRLVPKLKHHEQPKTKKNVLELSILKFVPFILLLIHGFLFSMAMSVMFVHLTALVQYLTNVSKLDASRFLMGYGIANFTGRVIQGVIAHIEKIHIFSQMLLSYMIMAICVILMTLTKEFWIMLIFGCVTSFMSVPNGILWPAITSEIVGYERLEIGFCYTNFACGIGLIVGAPIAGWIYSTSDDYKWSLYFTAVSIVCSVIVLLPPWWTSFNEHRRREVVSDFEMEAPHTISPIISPTKPLISQQNETVNH
ncbi:monocarboxylate transporter 14-like [Tubulanus polymorphus]|uniref:monocarboxylate transporter 14-like n=1 Tax=Tubulanus polymorphus TaxID=672921 RepID=UPI003DA4F59A